MDPLNRMKVGAGMVFYFIILPLLALSGPAYYVFKVYPTVQDFNQRCGTDYNLIDVALAADRIRAMCPPEPLTKDNE